MIKLYFPLLKQIPTILKVIPFILQLPSTTVSVERSFSFMNILFTKKKFGYSDENLFRDLFFYMNPQTDTISIQNDSMIIEDEIDTTINDSSMTIVDDNEILSNESENEEKNTNFNSNSVLSDSLDDILSISFDNLSTFSSSQLIKDKFQLISTRELRIDEIKILERNGNHVENNDWRTVRIIDDGEIDDSFLNYVVGNTFFGDIVFGCFQGESVYNTVSIHNGLYNNTISNSMISKHCLILNNSMISSSLIDDFSILANNTLISGLPHCSFGNGTRLNLGNETGGIDVILYAESNYTLLCDLYIHFHATTPTTAHCEMLWEKETKRQRQEKIHNYEDQIRSYCDMIRSDYTFIGSHCLVEGCASIQGVYMTEGSTIQNSTVIESTLLSSLQEPLLIESGSTVVSSICQWGVHISLGAMVLTSMLLEHSHVTETAKCDQIILCANSAIGRGECISSFIGPFTNMHHESLCISALISSGRVNISYGSKVGSNHTSRYPDQEGYIGEGVFIGLDVNLKYPQSSVEAPYSIFSAGITALPQRLCMPFSLINLPSFSSSSLSPAYNEIFPGWCIYSGSFALLRNQDKFINRDKSHRTLLNKQILRKETVMLIKKARDSLLAVDSSKAICFKDTEAIYTETAISGLGKNYLTDVSRVKGIEAYNFFIHLYYLRYINTKLSEYAETQHHDKYDYILSLPNTLDLGQEWFEAILNFPGCITIGDLLHLYIETESLFLTKCLNSLLKDQQRGIKIQPTYFDTHEDAHDNSLLKKQMKELEDEKYFLLEKEKENSIHLELTSSSISHSITILQN
ncbi:hypothetical protein WA158_000778 [Blastocystis sp. Blastoise]